MPLKLDATPIEYLTLQKTCEGKYFSYDLCWICNINDIKYEVISYNSEEVKSGDRELIEIYKRNWFSGRLSHYADMRNHLFTKIGPNTVYTFGWIPHHYIKIFYICGEPCLNIFTLRSLL